MRNTIVMFLLAIVFCGGCFPSKSLQPKVTIVDRLTILELTPQEINERSLGALGYWQPNIRLMVLPHFTGFDDYNTLVIYGHELAHVMGYDH